mgnify:CR=1 FL=1
MTKYNINFNDLNDDIKKVIFKKRYDLMRDDKYKKIYDNNVKVLNVIFKMIKNNKKDDYDKNKDDYYLNDDLDERFNNALRLPFYKDDNNDINLNDYDDKQIIIKTDDKYYKSYDILENMIYDNDIFYNLIKGLYKNILYYDLL